MTIETMDREFRYDEIRLPDPNPRQVADEIRTAFSATYPEIATAALTGPEAVGNKLCLSLRRRSAPRDDQEEGPRRASAK